MHGVILFNDDEKTLYDVMVCKSDLFDELGG